MMILAPILVQALQACEEIPSASGTFCYSRIADSHKSQGVAPWHLKELAKQGLLQRVDGSRGGHRAYYRLNPHAIR